MVPSIASRNYAKKFPDPTEAVICKPPQGSGGRRIVEMAAGSLEGFLSGVDENYIVQERVKIDDVNGGTEIRYVRKLDSESRKILRVYEEGSAPKLSGSEGKTKRQIIFEDPNLSFTSKIATLRQNLGSLKQVVPDDGSIHVSSIGMNEKASPEWGLAYSHRVENMDRFMAKFIADLQTEIGHELPLLCFDIGVTDVTAIDAEYDFDKLKQVLVFFECQMPFTVTGYVTGSHKNPSGAGPGSERN